MDLKNRFIIVGIGASAGGLEALGLFFQGLREPPGMAFVVVSHIGRDRPSELATLLSNFTTLSVLTVEDGMQIAPDQVYVSPPGVTMTMSGGRVKITHDGSDLARTKAIDVFFSSLAEDQGEYAAAIVLSGLDGDGTLGIKAMKERNGLTMAQTGKGPSPKFDSMPQSAIATGLVDLALPAQEMGPRLIEFARGMGALADLGPGSRRTRLDDIINKKAEICTILLDQLGHDFSGYKDATFARRVQRRCLFLNIALASEYVEKLRAEPAEAATLFRDLLINVTDFFRDADAFESLAKDVVPSLLENRTSQDALRVWVPGCATGEEVFSLAILLMEAIDGRESAPRLQVFATDIDERALDVARAGRYPASMMKEVSEERRKRFFVKDGEGYLITRAIREICIFSPHSVFRDPPFSRIDLVSCRNLLIYLGGDVQHQVLPIFHYSLRARGYLFLGLSENIGSHTELFEAVDRKNRIFRARGDKRAMPQLPFRLDRKPGYPASVPRSSSVSRLRREAEVQILERHAPQFVLVNTAGDIVYFSSDTGSFLQPSAGAPTRALIDLVRRGARVEVRSALRECMETWKPVRRTGLRIEVEPGRMLVHTITIEPLAKREGEEPLLLAVFHQTGEEVPGRFAETASQSAISDNLADVDAEMQDIRDRLQATIEEYETSMEELRSANEELVSLNEEQQSSNEELEASREELQSLNEELQTVNAELKMNIIELDAANEDLRHFFESTEVATVFLDSQLTIRNYTVPALEVFRMKPSDKGRALADLSTRIDYPNFEVDLQTCLLEGSSKSVEVPARDGGTYYRLLIRPFDKLRNSEAGLVVTATDITELVQLRNLSAGESDGSES
jgi:two-component system CheB/CheR fusion protein